MASFSEQQMEELKSLLAEALAPINVRLDGIYERLDGIYERLDGIEGKVDGIGKNVQALVSHQPDIALQEIKKFVVGNDTTGVEENASRDGADSTWTFMRHGDKYLAVGSAHCANRRSLSKTSKSSKKRRRGHDDCPPDNDYIGTKQFIEVPQSLAGRVTSVFFLPGVIGKKAPRTREDIVVLELSTNEKQELPEGLPVWRTVAGNASNICVRGRPLAGVSLSRTIYSSSSAWSEGKTRILMNLDKSEGGHSGTLIFDTQQQPLQDQCLGVLTGSCKGSARNVDARSEVCPLPDFREFQEYRVADAPPEEFKLYFGNSKKQFMRAKEDENKYVHKGDEIYGVFVHLDPSKPE